MADENRTAYASREWHTGDVITADALNKIENEMEYVSEEVTNAVTGTINDQKLNDTLARKLDSVVKYFPNTPNPATDLKYVRMYAQPSTEDAIIVPKEEEYLKFKQNFVQPFTNKDYVAGSYVEYEDEIYKVKAAIAKNNSAADDAAAWEAILAQPSLVKKINPMEELNNLINVYTSDGQLTNEQNRIWIQQNGESVEVPTYEEFTSLSNSVVDLKSAFNNGIIIANKDMTKPGAKVNAEGIVQYTTQNKYRYFDVDVSMLKKYQTMKLVFKNNTEYHMLLIFVFRNAAGATIMSTTWFEMLDGDDIYSKYIAARLTSDEIKTISCTYVFSPDTIAGNAITGINELDYDFIFTKIDYAKQVDFAIEKNKISTLQNDVSSMQNDLASAQDKVDFVSTALTESHIEDKLTSAITSNARNTAKWILTTLPENAKQVKLKVVIPANSVEALTMQVYEYNNTSGKYVYSKDIDVEFIETYTKVEGNYIATYKTFNVANKALITYSDTSSRGYIQFLSVTGASERVYDDLTATEINPSSLRTVNNVQLLRYIEYLTMKQFKTKNNIVYVDADGSADYTSVVDAVENEPSGTTIVVRPGIYDGSIRAFTKRVNIIGTDREKCIIRSTNGLYANPAMECCCGYLENLTFYSQYIQGESEEIGTNSGAYAVHCENISGNDSIAMGDHLTFVNCDLISDFCPALGVGSFADWSLNLYNCRLISNQTADRSVYVGSGGLGALYFHDMNGTRGTAIIRVHNCVIQTTVLANTMCPYDLDREGANIICEFINNTIYSAVNGFTDSIWWRGGQGAFGNNFHLSPLSHGNTGNTFNNS